jgi:hypothetical protein
MKTQKKLHEVLREAPDDIPVPWFVYRLFGPGQKHIRLSGPDASFGEDFGNIHELRLAVEWYADQLGLEVKLKKEKK